MAKADGKTIRTVLAHLLAVPIFGGPPSGPSCSRRSRAMPLFGGRCASSSNSGPTETSSLAGSLTCRVRQSSSPVDSEEDRAQWAKSTAQAPIRPAIGLHFSAALFAAAFIAKNALAAEWAGFVLFLLLFVFLRLGAALY